jgi:tetratricopeptide (TPR) repeat protein
MDRQVMAQILTGDSDEIAELKLNLPLLEGFIDLTRRLEALPQTSKRFYEESRSIYQATCTKLPMGELEAFLAKFFGEAVKPAGKALPRKLRKNASVKYLGGIEKDQSLFILPLHTGEFYAALWPWRRNASKIEIHMGYCSDTITDAHYQQLETLIKRSLSHSTFQQMEAQVGGQIRGIGLPSFLQMSELEQSSFTLHISSAGRVGQLHVSEGVLIAAQTGNLAGSLAAYQIISWDDATIEIAPADASQQNDIQQPLMHILMESLKLKDEITSSAADGPPQRPPPKSRRPDAAPPGKRLVRLERPPEPRPRRKRMGLIFLAVFIGALVIVGTMAVVALYVIQNRSMSDQYAQLNAQVEKADLPEKIELLRRYIQSTPQTPHAAEIQTRIDQLHQQMHDRDFDQITLQISSLIVNEEYEQKAITLYSDFLSKYPESRYTGKINEAIGGIRNLLDQYYYEELRRAARLDYSNRLAVYRKYLERFPEGRYRADLNVLIQEMGTQYLDFLQVEDAQCEQTQRLDPCIQRYQAFLEGHEGMPIADEARRRLMVLKDKQDLAQLRKTASEAGTDYQQAIGAFTQYLAANPDSTQKKTIETEIAALQAQLRGYQQWTVVRRYATDPSHHVPERIQRLEHYLRDNRSSRHAVEAQGLINQLQAQGRQSQRQMQIEAQKQEEQARIRRDQEQAARQRQRMLQLQADIEQQLGESQRYRSNGDGTFTDTTTGLKWTLLDSHQALDACADYPAALTYVKALKTGGHSDWRLPSANELATLYKRTPFFPISAFDWYWTSQAYVRGHHAVADVVTTKSEAVFIREFRSQEACGAVRAVRP